MTNSTGYGVWGMSIGDATIGQTSVSRRTTVQTFVRAVAIPKDQACFSLGPLNLSKRRYRSSVEGQKRKEKEKKKRLRLPIIRVCLEPHDDIAWRETPASCFAMNRSDHSDTVLSRLLMLYWNCQQSSCEIGADTTSVGVRHDKCHMRLCFLDSDTGVRPQ